MNDAIEMQQASFWTLGRLALERDRTLLAHYMNEGWICVTVTNYVYYEIKAIRRYLKKFKQDVKLLRSEKFVSYNNAYDVHVYKNETTIMFRTIDIYNEFSQFMSQLPTRETIKIPFLYSDVSIFLKEMNKKQWKELGYYLCDPTAGEDDNYILLSSGNRNLLLMAKMKWQH